MFAAVKLLSEGEGHTRNSLRSALVARKDLDASSPESEAGANDVIEELENALLIVTRNGEIQLSTEDVVNDRSRLLFSGREVSESIRAANDTEAYERILTNLTYAHPELLTIAREIYRKKPLEKYEIKRNLAGEAPFGNNLNDFTIDIGVDLLADADVIRHSDRGYVDGDCPITLLAHILHEAYDSLSAGADSVTDQRLYERIELMYGIERSDFDRHLSRLQRLGYVVPGSYGELTLEKKAFRTSRIHE